MVVLVLLIEKPYLSGFCPPGWWQHWADPIPGLFLKVIIQNLSLTVKNGIPGGSAWP